ERDYYPEGYVISYAEAGAAVAQYVSALSAAGYGHGHRIAILGVRNDIAFRVIVTLGMSGNPDQGVIAIMCDGLLKYVANDLAFN
ncbi:MAG: hypothetical protein AAF639_43210, partial [Chloroflexota bacterium]